MKQSANSVVRCVLMCVVGMLLIAGLAPVIHECNLAWAEEPEVALELDDCSKDESSGQESTIEVLGNQPGNQDDALDYDLTVMRTESLVDMDSTEEESAATELIITKDPAVQVQSSGVNVSNPRVKPDSSMTSGQVTTWDCVWFGSYPQSEIKPGTAEYTSLLSASWDAKGDATIGDNKYRRVTKEDATTSLDWPDDSPECRFFRYEPIKWRVLDVSGNTAFVMADISLDDQSYSAHDVNITWKTSGVRSWLNGYGASSNEPGTDYSNKNFIDTAFSPEEKSAIFQTNLLNADNSYYHTPGGNNTLDKVFLLSEDEVGNASYGFADSKIDDEARRCKASDYSVAMGANLYSSGGIFDGNAWWWLRSPGEKGSYACCSDYYGFVDYSGDYVYGWCNAIRPAMNIDITSSNIKEAGTVSSNGIISILSAKVTGIKGRVYNGEAQKQSPKLVIGNKTLKKGTDYKISYQKNVNAGTAIMIIKGIGSYTGSIKKTFTISKASNPIKVKAVKRTVLAAKTKKKAQVVSKPIKFVRKAKGKVTYKRVSKGSSKYLTVNKKNGKVTVKKGTKKGTYKIKIKITAAGNDNYKSATKTLTCTVVVK